MADGGLCSCGYNKENLAFVKDVHGRSASGFRIKAFSPCCAYTIIGCLTNSMTHTFYRAVSNDGVLSSIKFYMEN